MNTIVISASPRKLTRVRSVLPTPTFMANSTMSLRRSIELCAVPEDLAKVVLEALAQSKNSGGFGTFSPSIYDTAWLSMIPACVGERTGWLFPECFTSLLESQQPDGAWKSYAAPIDGILNTLAALLALLRHQQVAAQDFDSKHELAERTRRAQSGLDTLLQRWNVDGTNHVGFEILVPGLLTQIEKFGIRFEFLAKDRLLHHRDEKLSKLPAQILYSHRQTTLLHSLEAFVDVIDFDRLMHHCKEGLGMLGSPASTAAYLINCTKWDVHAEAYLRQVVAAYQGSGGVPSAFPTSIFEASWTLSTLLMHTAPLGKLSTALVSEARDVLEQLLQSQNGTLGFAPGALEDVDDTARVLLTLRLLGSAVDEQSLITKFETDEAFSTYEVERNPSFSANCNVLLSLITSGSVDSYQPQICKILKFLLSAWNDGCLSDKWNSSPLYISMLMLTALTRLLRSWDQGHLRQMPVHLLHHEIPLTICQMVSQLLISQRSDGSWSDSTETTAYACLAIIESLSLPWDLDVKRQMSDQLYKARSYLASKASSCNAPEYHWTEKVSYGSLLLSKAYYLSATYASSDEVGWSQQVIIKFQSTGSTAETIGRFIMRLPLFDGIFLHCPPLAYLEAIHYVVRLKSHKDDVFTRDDKAMSKDKYVEYLPLIWTMCNQVTGSVLTPHQLWSMIRLSLLNYQIDEFMETSVARLSAQELLSLTVALAHHLKVPHTLNSTQRSASVEVDHLDKINGYHTQRQSEQDQVQEAKSERSSFDQAFESLKKYIAFILECSAVTSSPYQDQKELSHAIYQFICAHIKHNSDNELLRKSRQPNRTNETHETVPPFSQSFFGWVTSSAAVDTSCPCAFKFFTCLISTPGSSLFDQPLTRYVSESLAYHLATMCRQYNDYGSYKRDIAENNLNSLDFPEFRANKTPTTADTDLVGTADDDGAEQRMKNDLMKIAEFERANMTLAREHLERAGTSPSVLQKLLVFVRVTDLFGQLYVQRDIASRMQAADGSKKPGS